MAPLAPLAVPLVAGGIGLSAISQIQAGRDEESALRRNADLGRAEGAEALRAGRERARLTRGEARRATARQRVGAAHAGVKSFTGTPRLLQIESLSEFEREADIFAAEGATTRSQLFSQAEFDEERGRKRRRAGVFGAGSTLLTGAGGLALASR